MENGLNEGIEGGRGEARAGERGRGRRRGGERGRGPRGRLFSSDLFTIHFTKIQREHEYNVRTTYDVHCNYCTKVYVYRAGEGYGRFMQHLRIRHPDILN